MLPRVERSGAERPAAKTNGHEGRLSLRIRLGVVAVVAFVTRGIIGLKLLRQVRGVLLAQVVESLLCGRLVIEELLDELEPVARVVENVASGQD